MRLMWPAASTAAASAWSSCTFPIWSAGNGSRSEWRPSSRRRSTGVAILDQLVRADVFEQTIHSRYIGTKRYSLEGNTALIPLLDEILNSASENGAEQAVLAMSHRGRLNVIINIVSRPAAEIFAGFEDVDPRSVLRRRRREVPHRRDRDIYRGQWPASAHSHGFQSQPPGSRRSRGAGHGREPSKLAWGATAKSRCCRSSCMATPPLPGRELPPRLSTSPICAATTLAEPCTSSSTI